jgi:hypothetical protein
MTRAIASGIFPESYLCEGVTLFAEAIHGPAAKVLPPYVEELLAD